MTQNSNRASREPGDLGGVFPLPQEIASSGTPFPLDEQTRIVIPEAPSQQDRSLAAFLTAELCDRFGLALETRRLARLPEEDRFILMGSLSTPLVQQYCARNAVEITEEDPGPEGYLLQAQDRSLVIAGSDERGAFYGLQTLRQLLDKQEGRLMVPGVHIRDWPHKPFRGIRLHLPGRENLSFFRRFMRDFMALYKFNTLVIETNACMRFDRHPEVNAGWIEFAESMNYTRRNASLGPRGYFGNSPHHDSGDGGILEKREVREMVDFASECHLEVIPEITSLTHSYYLLTRHRELADVPYAEWPSTCCPSNPATHDLLFDIMDEYIEVMRPRMVHIGHDEWWGAPMGICPQCRDRDPSELFAQDVNKVYDYLTKQDIKTAMWGDHLVEEVRGAGPNDRTYLTGGKYQTPGALPPSLVETSIPKDILLFNWFWSRTKSPDAEGGEHLDVVLQEMGFEQIYGNFGPNIQDWERRSSERSVLGGAPSTWAATNELNFGKHLLTFLGCGNLLWSTHWPEAESLLDTVQDMAPQIRHRLSGLTPPSEAGDPVVCVDLASHLNLPCDRPLMGQELPGLRVGELVAGKRRFQLADPDAGNGMGAIVVGSEGKQANPLPRSVEGIEVGKDASSLIFLHACAKPERHNPDHRHNYNFADADALLGWYEVVYEDGFVETVPIRYRENILEWQRSSGNYCYGADPVVCSSPDQQESATFNALEWTNPRFGKTINEVRLRGSTQFVLRDPISGTAEDQMIESNAVILLALSVVEKREPHPDSKIVFSDS